MLSDDSRLRFRLGDCTSRIESFQTAGRGEQGSAFFVLPICSEFSFLAAIELLVRNLCGESAQQRHDHLSVHTAELSVDHLLRQGRDHPVAPQRGIGGHGADESQLGIVLKLTVTRGQTS